MEEKSVGHFSFKLLDLPPGKFVMLSDALELALYGGIRSIRYEGPREGQAAEDGMLVLTDSGAWALMMDEGNIPGPKVVEVARPGAVLFGIDDSTEPDPIETAKYEQWYQARLREHELMTEKRVRKAAMLGNAPSDGPASPTPRRRDPKTIVPSWRAETSRRRERFLVNLNVAARSGAVRFKGTAVEGDWVTEPSTYLSVPTKIPIAYFSKDRGFDEELNCIHAIGATEAGPGHDDDLSTDGLISYQDVVVKRSSYLRFLRSCYPTVLNPKMAQEQLSIGEARRRIAQALRDDPNMTKAEAADLVGWTVTSRQFLNSIWAEARVDAGLERKGLPGRKPKSTQS